MKEAVEIFTINQATSAIFDNLYVHQNFFCLVESGTKIVKCPLNGELIANDGDMIMFPPDFFVTLENRPTRDFNYRALATYISDDLISAEITTNEPIGVQLVSKETYQEFPIFKAFSDLILQNNLPEIVWKSRYREPFLWLHSIGYKFARQNDNSAVSRLRAIISNDLTHSWRSPEIASSMGMSEASLRRILAKSGTSFSNVLRNYRLETALGYLQTTNKAIIEIAYECGFKTPAHFSDAFRKRFGIPPKAIRIRGF